MREESFWRRYFKTLSRHKILAAATFSVIVGSFGVTVLQVAPVPEFYAEGVLVDNQPLVSVSETSLEIGEQGKGIIDEDLLLSDIVLITASQKLSEQEVRLTPMQLVEKTRVAIDSVVLTGDSSSEATNKSGSPASKVTLRVVDEDSEVAEATLEVMMQVMIELSEATNKSRLQRISEELTARVSEIKGSIQEDTAALQAASDESSRVLLEKQIELKETALDEAIALLADADLAAPEIVSSLVIASPPFVVINDPEEPSPLFVMASGVSTAVLVVGWLIFGLSNLSKEKPPENSPGNGLTESTAPPNVNNQPPQLF